MTDGFSDNVDIADLVGDAHYTDMTRWVLLDDQTQGRKVLVLLGESWTVMSLAEFVRLVTRILEQLA